jgi:S1-C subfamily serine protease
MKNKKGFIQIPILIAIIAGVLAIGSAGYFGVRQYQNYQVERTEREKVTQEKERVVQEEQQQRDSEVEKLKGELEGLKKQQTEKAQQQSTNSELTNAGIIKKVKPAVVYIETPYGVGSGMIFERAGYVLTNAHVVKETGAIKITLNDGRIFGVDSVALDEDADIAILKIDATNLPVVEFANSDVAQQGDEVFTFGFPFGIKGDVSFKEGTISRRLTEKGQTYIETSAEIHPGNSGGPLVNKFGKVIGVNTGKLGDSVKGIILGESIKFAIPINVASNLVPWLKSKTRSSLSFTSDCASQRARGFVTVYSLLSSPQKMIATTRLTPSSGLIFRIDEDIFVPPAKIVSGEIIPGEIKVSMTADKMGSEYKIGPSTFTIPGFAGTDKYDKLYAKSFQPTTCN